MEFKGTKGKWYIYHNTQGHNSFCINSKYKWIHKDEEEANALLISKAPEMLQMLQDLWSQDLLKDKQDEIYELIKQATDI